MFNIYKNLPKKAYTVFLAQFINKVGYFVYPFLTLYLTQKIGISFELAGLIVMIALLLNIPGSLIGGISADTIGRRKSYIIFQTLAALFLLPCAFFYNYIVTILCIFGATFCSGAVNPIMSSMITDLLPPEKRKEGFSLLYLSTNLGVAIGPVIAGFLYENYLSLLFICDSITSIISVILIYINITETTIVPKSSDKGIGKKEEIGLFQTLKKYPNVIFFLLIYIGYSFIYIQNNFSLPIALNFAFNENGAKFYGYLMSVNALVVILFTVIITNITKKLNTVVNIIIAGILYAIGFGMIGIIQSFELFIVSTLIWTIGEILIMCNFNVYMADNSPKGFIGRFNSLSTLSYSIGNSLGTVLIGKYIAMYKIDSVWFLIFVLGLISSFFMYLLYIYTKDMRIEENININEVNV